MYSMDNTENRRYRGITKRHNVSNNVKSPINEAIGRQKGTYGDIKTRGTHHEYREDSKSSHVETEVLLLRNGQNEHHREENKGMNIRTTFHEHEEDRITLQMERECP